MTNIINDKHGSEAEGNSKHRHRVRGLAGKLAVSPVNHVGLNPEHRTAKEKAKVTREKMDSSQTPVGDIARGLNDMLARRDQLAPDSLQAKTSFLNLGNRKGIRDEIKLNGYVGWKGDMYVAGLGENPLHHRYHRPDIHMLSIQRTTLEDGSDEMVVFIKSIERQSRTFYIDLVKLSLDASGMPVVDANSETHHSEFNGIDYLHPVDVSEGALTGLAQLTGRIGQTMDQYQVT